MDTMEIPNNPKSKKHAIVFFLVLCCIVYVSALVIEDVQKTSGMQSLYLWCIAIAMAVVSIRGFILLFESKASHLVASKPPILVTSTTWFGKLTAEKRLEMKGAAWVRTRRFCSEIDVLLVEVGTHGYQTSTIICLPYSERNISIATTSCSEIATFLKLEDKGYRGYA